MREYKFRAWETTGKRMVHFGIEWLVYNSDDDGTIIDEEYNPVSGGRACVEYRDLVIMQYTGLKDKNGKEIYEGDIIKDILTLNWFKVVFDNGRYKGEFIPHDSIAGGFDIDSMHKLDLNFYEVAGNIHENSELLK